MIVSSATFAQSESQRYFDATGTAYPETSPAALAAGDSAIAAGVGANAGGGASVAIGRFSNATDQGALAVGSYAVSSGENASAFGVWTISSGLQATAIGAAAHAEGDYAAAFGTRSVARGANSLAVGAYAEAGDDGSVALGAGSSVLEANSVALGKASVAAPLGGLAYAPSGVDASLVKGLAAVGQVSIGSAGNERRLTNVAAGANDTDAVNLSQLKALESKTDSSAAKLDGAMTYDQHADGSVNKDSLTLGGDPAAGGTAIHNVADGVDANDAVNLAQLNAAISGAVNNVAVNLANTATPFFSAQGDLDTESAVSSGVHSVAAGANAQATGANAAALGANSSASGNNATALGASASARADNSVALGQGSVADRANTVSVGVAGQERQIANVAAGVQGTDAVNVNQLNQSAANSVGQAHAYTDDQIRSARRDGYGGTAAALAVAGLPQAVLPGRGMVAMAGGTYGGQSAMALGVSQLSPTGKWAYKVQGTTDSRGQFGASVGAGMHW
ncbi:YadA family autotransporter adhesin [Paraburkholderia sp. BCC1884]|uniref:YadA family autotransporter adhesin n=1 Tax=Paraburkholderia sp. BCC1884 TaxID=2562668 RepID=UPI0011846807|nr:YadA-like family protein [Paraburkholderia sp. BCC1884]